MTQANYLNAFFSHDEYIDFFAAGRGLGLFEDIRKEYHSVNAQSGATYAIQTSGRGKTILL